MFEELLALLPFNPSLIHQMSFYGRRLRAEKSIRRVGLIFIILAFAVQFFAVISPSQPTSAYSTNDLVNGGFDSAAEAASYCSQNIYNYGQILANYGITCAHVAASPTITIHSTDFNRELYSMGRQPYGIAGETPVTIPSIPGQTFYVRYLWGWDTGAPSEYQALNVTTPGGQTLLLLYRCGNLTSVGVPQPVTPKPAPTPPPKPTPKCKYDSSILASSSQCVVCAYNSGIIASSPQCKPTVCKYDSSLPASSPKCVPCKYNSSIIASSPDCRAPPAPAPPKCKYDSSILASSSQCVVCAYNSGIIASSPQCKPTVCKYDSSLPASSPKCVPCKYNSSIIASSPDCRAPPAPAPPKCKYDSSILASSSQCVVCAYNSGIIASNAQCKPCQASLSSEDTLACVIVHKTAADLTQGVSDANGITAQPNDKILYTLYADNTGKAAVKDYVFQDPLSDVLDYATVTNPYGGSVAASSGIITWPKVTIPAGKTVTVKVEVSVMSVIPQTPASASDPEHDNLIMTNVYGNTININVPGSPAKTVELASAQLVNTGPGSSLFIAAGIMIVAGYFFARTRLLAKETTIAIEDTVNGGL
jgi:uncharacterized repeat protein (TIGR01451 family)